MKKFTGGYQIVATCSTKSVRITKADKCTVVDLVG